MTGKPTFKRGIHPPARKAFSEGLPIEVLPAPESVMIPLHQHAGAAAVAAVKPRAELQIGDLIGQAAAGVSANVHASIAGVAQAITAVTLPNGRRSLAIPIRVKAKGETAEPATNGREIWDRLFGGEWPLRDAADMPTAAIIAAVSAAGIVGMGGAAFPTHLKLNPAGGQRIESVLLNGCECEPYLTSDTRLMIEAPAAIIAGLRLLMQATGARQAVIAIEDNKPAAIEAMQTEVRRCGRDDVRGRDGVRVLAVVSKYPMGGERQLIPAVFGREVPTSHFPPDIGILVSNVATAAAVAGAVLRGQPLTHRVVSVSGNGIEHSKNLLAPIGTPLSRLLEFCGGLKPNARRVIAGGPMMGFTVTDLLVPLTKATGGITVLTAEDLPEEQALPCIRCGRCLDACPLGLAPTRIAHAALHQDFDLARQFHLQACCECGCCAYVCPSHIPLAQFIRTGKLAMTTR